jgi:hypothetical protein
MPAHSELLHLVSEHVAVEQQQPASDNPALERLRGHPELLAIAQNDPMLAVKLQWLIESIMEADWTEARSAWDHIGFSLRTHSLDSQVDEAGVAKR